MGKSQRAAAAFSKAGDHAPAAEHYRKARQRVAAAAELAAAGDRQEAVRILMQVADNSPERESATLQLVPLLLDQGEGEEALRRMRQLPPVRPSALTPTADRAPLARDRLYWIGISHLLTPDPASARKPSSLRSPNLAPTSCTVTLRAD